MRTPDSVLAYDSVYTGHWESSFEQYDGVDYSRYCFTFTGQGSAFPGMFQDLYRRLAPFKDRFDTADRFAREQRLPPVSGFITDTIKKADPSFSLIRNLALVTSQVALFDHITGRGLKPQAVTGFSLGEFAAIACAGVITFEQMLDLVLTRDRCCPPDNELGFLVAVDASPAQMRCALTNCDYTFSNFNSPHQTVVAVRPGSLNPLLGALRRTEFWHKALLTVPQPYHSQLMNESAQRFRTAMEKSQVSFRRPTIPVVSSITKAILPVDCSRRAMIDVLSRQLIEPLEFILQVEIAYLERCYSFMEIGPGSTVAKLTSEILTNREHRIRDASEFLPVKAPDVRVSEPESKSLFAKVQAAVAKVTGYELEKITVEDRFQEDLGIDSIKKANILFTVLNEENGGTISGGYDSSAVRNLGEAVAVLSGAEQKEEDVRPAREAIFERYSTIWSASELVEPTDRCACTEKITVLSLTEVLNDKDVAPLLPGSRLLLIQAGPEVATVSQLARVTERLGRITANLSHDLDLFFVTDDKTSALSYGLVGFFKSLRKERPNIFFRHVHYDNIPDASGLVESIERESRASNEIEVRYQGGSRLVADHCWTSSNNSGMLPKDAVIVAFGCAKGIGGALLKRLDFPGRPVVYVVGRSSPGEVRSFIEVLSSRFMAVKYIQADAKQTGPVESLLQSVRRKHKRLDVILNSVGIQDSRLLESKSSSNILEELSSKIATTTSILTAAQKSEAALVVNCSSVVARWGNPGQTIYACANQVMNRLTEEHNRRLGRQAAIAIEWPAWDGVGMTAEPAILNRLRSSGLALIEPETATKLLSADIAQSTAEVSGYLDRRDVVSWRAALLDHRPYRLLIGNPTVDGFFERVFDTSADKWLMDHSIEGTAYLPAATSIAMALCLANHVKQASCAQVRNFQILRPVQIRNGSIAVRLGFADYGDFLLINGKSAGTYFTVEVGPCGGWKPANSAALIENWSNVRAYEDGTLFHGKAFQVLHGIATTPAGHLAGRINTTRFAPLYGLPEWDRVTLLLDGAFQLLALQAFNRFSVQALPTGIKRMGVYPNTEGQMILSIWRCDLIDGVVHGSVDIHDEQRRLVMQIEGIEMAVTGGSPHN